MEVEAELCDKWKCTSNDSEEDKLAVPLAVVEEVRGIKGLLSTTIEGSCET